MQFSEYTIGRLLENTASSYPDNEALVFPAKALRLSYAELRQKCRRLARGLMALGIEKGDHVSVWTTNLPEWVYLQFALGMIGGVLVTVNTNYKSSELEYILKQSDSTTLIFMERHKDNLFFEILKRVIPDPASGTPSIPGLKNLVSIENLDGIQSFDEIMELASGVTEDDLDKRMDSISPHDTINMQYTSGTTGFPKGVMLTHYNIVNNARMVGDVMGMTENDRLLIQVPLFHCFGCVMSTLNCLYHASTMVVVESFSPIEALEYIQAENCTAINGVPTMFIAILNHEDFAKYDMSTLRTGIMAGAPCPVEVMNQVRELMHCNEIVIAFGQTECAPVMTMTRRDDPVELRVSTVGRLLPGIEGRIVDPNTGEVLPPDTQGEIVTRSPCVMKGYYKMEKETNTAIDKEGWLHTGDLGVIDTNGYFKVTGRIKEMIIRGGENIYPREIEEFLHSNTKISDVYVVGIPDEHYGEQILAVVRLNENSEATEDELTEFCRGKIARHKIPRYWEFVADFPMTASGKVQKFKIVDQFVRKYQSAPAYR